MQSNLIIQALWVIILSLEHDRQAKMENKFHFIFAKIDRLDRLLIYSLTRTMIDTGTERTIEGIND